MGTFEHDGRDVLPDITEQRKFLIARARGLSEYALGPLPAQYAAQKQDMITGAVSLWQQVIEDGQEKAAVEAARKYLARLQEAASDK